MRHRERARLGLAMSAGQMGAYELDIVADRTGYPTDMLGLDQEAS